MTTERDVEAVIDALMSDEAIEVATHAMIRVRIKCHPECEETAKWVAAREAVAQLLRGQFDAARVVQREPGEHDRHKHDNPG